MFARLTEIKAAVQAGESDQDEHEEPPGVAKQRLTWLSLSQIARGELAEAVRTAEALRVLAPEDPKALASVAELFARCASAVGDGAATDQLGEADRSARADYVERAIAVLGQAVEHGFGLGNPGLLSRDSDFIILRQHPRYQSLLERVSRGRDQGSPPGR